MTIKQIIFKYLIKSQKFTKTDNIYLATQGSYLTLGNIINTIASFLLAMAFARLLPKEIYGDYRYVISIITIIGIFALPGMDDAVLQAVANKFDKSFREGLKEKLKWSILGSLSCLIVGGYFLLLKNNLNLSISFIIAGVFFPIMQSTGLYLSYLGGKKIFGIQTKYNTLTQVITTLFIIITLFLTNNLIILVLIYFLSYSTLGIIFLFTSLKKFPPNENNDNKFIIFGKHLSLLYVMSVVSGQIDRILLFHFLGAAQLAIYSFAILPTSEASIFLKNIRLLALPKFSARSKEEIKKNLLKKIYRMTLLMVPLIIIFVIISPFIYKILFPQYIESVNLSRLFFIYIIFFPASLIPLYFQAQMMKKELYKFSIVSSFAALLLLIILIPIYGLMGAIIARIIAQIIAVSLSIFLFRKN
ncbi:MAG: oligosaccharide flippase family protein [Nanoarchaeota archaeon]|nr:oligosaccharide flippase family protein [Nanoarchaeota archaeon]